MKVEKKLPTQNEVSPISKEDDSYNTSIHKAAYTNAEKVNQPSTTTYGDAKGANLLYIVRYDYAKKRNQPSITGYNQLYIVRYAYAKRKNPPNYITTNSDSEVTRHDYKDDRTEAFTLGDIYVGNKMALQFPVEDFPHFVTRKEADSIPFSIPQLPSVLQLFSIPQDSLEAQAMRGTVEQCELQPLTGETSLSISSLESMIDFVRSIIGPDSHFDILTTTLPATSECSFTNLTVLEVSQDIYAPKWVACHTFPYPCAVFFSHFISTGTKIFKVRLGSENGGEKTEALGICHLDTSEWNPDHVLFKQFGIKPGKSPLCHFLPPKHLMRVSSSSKSRHVRTEERELALFQICVSVCFR